MLHYHYSIFILNNIQFGREKHTTENYIKHCINMFPANHFIIKLSHKDKQYTYAMLIPYQRSHGLPPTILLCGRRWPIIPIYLCSASLYVYVLYVYVVCALVCALNRPLIWFLHSMNIDYDENQTKRAPVYYGRVKCFDRHEPLTQKEGWPSFR